MTECSPSAISYYIDITGPILPFMMVKLLHLFSLKGTNKRSFSVRCWPDQDTANFNSITTVPHLLVCPPSPCSSLIAQSSRHFGMTRKQTGVSANVMAMHTTPVVSRMKYLYPQLDSRYERQSSFSNGNLSNGSRKQVNVKGFFVVGF
jgi:hypothetical protein